MFCLNDKFEKIVSRFLRVSTVGQSKVFIVLYLLNESLQNVYLSCYFTRSLSPTPCVIVMLLFSIADFGLARKFYDPSKPMTPKVVTLW